MTREDRALDLLRDHIPPAAKLLQIGSPGGECWILEVVLAFADAEAAAMRERAAEIADGEAGRWGDNPCADSAARVIAANIRALPATGEVGRC